MKFVKTDIEGVLTAELPINADKRGWLIELFRSDSLPKDFSPAMSYISLTHPGVIRGPHEHKEQTDLIVFIGSSKFDLYLWDNREDSSTFGKNLIIKSDLENSLAIIIPPGIVHGYKNISDSDGFAVNMPDKLYAGQNKEEIVDEIRYENNPDSPFRID